MAAILTNLLHQSEDDRAKAWKEFFLNVEAVREVSGSVNNELAVQILQCGLAWGGAGWTTALAARRVYELTGTPFLSHVFSDYHHAWLCALALVGAADVPDDSYQRRQQSWPLKWLW